MMKDNIENIISLIEKLYSSKIRYNDEKKDNRYNNDNDFQLTLSMEETWFSFNEDEHEWTLT